jgi:Dynamin central region
MKPQIKLLEGPSLRYVELVYEELAKICHNCTSTELQWFPRLHAQLVEVVSSREGRFVSSTVHDRASSVGSGNAFKIPVSIRISNLIRSASTRCGRKA